MDGSIRVEWGEPVQFNDTPIWFSSHGQHAWWGGSCRNSHGQKQLCVGEGMGVGNEYICIDMKLI